LKIPSSLIDSLIGTAGFDQSAFEKVHLSGEQNTSIRFNNHKPVDISTVFSVGNNNEAVVISPVLWNANGRYLSARPSFTADPLIHGGAYYVQEASSMFLEEAVRQSIDLAEPIRVLDLCAAPGGKSTLLQSAISDKSILVSNEVIKSRVTILSENITKWGAANVVVTNNDPKDFQRLPGYFDLIVVDAPCSGSGLFRKDPKAINEWSVQNVELCSQRQQRILADILPALKPGGTLIYSTCSYSPAEDEAICDWLISDCALSSIRFQLKSEWNIIETKASHSNANGYRFYPDKLKGEGFFIAAFRKENPAETETRALTAKGKSERLTSKEIEVVKPWLCKWDDFFFIKQHDEVIAIPLHIENDLAIIQSALYIKKAGVKVGVIIRNELIPAHELALSNIINPLIPAIEVDKATALQYLRKQEISVGSNAKGWILITYLQIRLGWVKVLPNRINNYYPKDWRIINK
jgi:16S rRNA C967 or C1407 C5-methylase (RsmB/RsmF family)/NOL1/NOP2/fmu family ribosome biogenesis protein